MITQPVAHGGLNYPSIYWKSSAAGRKAEHIQDRGVLLWFLKRKPCLLKQSRVAITIQQLLFFPPLWVSPGKQLSMTQLLTPSPQWDEEEDQMGESGKTCELR